MTMRLSFRDLPAALMAVSLSLALLTLGCASTPSSGLRMPLAGSEFTEVLTAPARRGFGFRLAENETRISRRNTEEYREGPLPLRENP